VITNLVGKTIKSVHRNDKSYIIKFDDGAVINIVAILRNNIPIIEFTPSIESKLTDKEIKKSIESKLTHEEKEYLIKHINGTLEPEEEIR